MVSKENFLNNFVEVVFTCAMAGSMKGMLKHFCTVLKGKKISALWCADCLGVAANYHWCEICI